MFLTLTPQPRGSIAEQQEGRLAGCRRRGELALPGAAGAPTRQRVDAGELSGSCSDEAEGRTLTDTQQHLTVLLCFCCVSG